MPKTVAKATTTKTNRPRKKRCYGATGKQLCSRAEQDKSTTRKNIRGESQRNTRLSQTKHSKNNNGGCIPLAAASTMRCAGLANVVLQHNSDEIAPKGQKHTSTTAQPKVTTARPITAQRGERQTCACRWAADCVVIQGQR